MPLTPSRSLRSQAGGYYMQIPFGDFMYLVGDWRKVKPRRGFACNNPQVSHVVACWGIASDHHTPSPEGGLHSQPSWLLHADPLRGSPFRGLGG